MCTVYLWATDKGEQITRNLESRDLGDIKASSSCSDPFACRNSAATSVYWRLWTNTYSRKLKLETPTYSIYGQMWLEYWMHLDQGKQWLKSTQPSFAPYNLMNRVTITSGKKIIWSSSRFIFPFCFKSNIWFRSLYNFFVLQILSG